MKRETEAQKKTIANGDIKRIYDETIDDDTPATDFQKERVLMRLGRTPQNIEFVKVMNYSFAQKFWISIKNKDQTPRKATRPKVAPRAKANISAPFANTGLILPNGQTDVWTLRF